MVVFHRALLEGEVLTGSSVLLRDSGLKVDDDMPRNNPILGDSVYCFVPWLRYASDAVREDGHLPLWKATAFCGAPLVGNGQSALFSPLNLLAVWLGAPPWIHGVMAAIKVVAACWFTFLLARYLGLAVAGSLLAGFLFGFGGFTTVFLLFPLSNVSLLLPLLILATDRLAASPTAPRFFQLALVCALQHLGGHPETAFHCQAVVGVTGLVRAVILARRGGERRWRREALRRGAVLSAAYVAGALLGAVQIVPLLEYIRESGTLQLRHGGPTWRLLEQPLASLVFVVALLGALVALRRLLTAGSHALVFGPMLLVSVAVGLAAGLHAGMHDFATVLLTSDWFGGPDGYAGAVNYVEANGAFVGAAVPVALLGLAIGRPRALVHALGGFLALGLLVGLRAPLASDLVQALPIFRLAANSRFQVFALLAFALLAGTAIDALRSPQVIIPRGLAWRSLLATLLLVAGALLGFARASHDGLFLRSQALAPPAKRTPLRATIDRAAATGDGSWTIAGRAAPTRRPVSGALLFGPEDAAPVKLAALTDPDGALDEPDSAGTWVFTAQIPASQFTGQGLHLLLADEAGAKSLSPAMRSRSTWEYAIAFPSMPIGRKGFVQMGLLALGAVLVAVAAAARGRVRTLLVIPVVALVVISVGTFSLIFHPSLPGHLFYPATPAVTFLQGQGAEGRILFGGIPYFHPEVATYHGIRDVRGYDALTPARIELLLQKVSPLDAPEPSGEVRATDLRLLGMMSVRYLDRARGEAADAVAIPIERSGRDPLVVHENPAFLPRARLVAGVVVEPDDERALARLADPTFDPRTTTVMIASDAEPRAAPSADLGNVHFELDRPDRVRLAARAAARCYLVLADTYFPGWKAFVDDREVPILRANLAFRAVALDPGAHIVEFRYEPRSFRLGSVLSLVTLSVLLLLLALVASARGRRRRQLGSQISNSSPLLSATP